jgi:hypothetical protein
VNGVACLPCIYRQREVRIWQIFQSHVHETLSSIVEGGTIVNSFDREPRGDMSYDKYFQQSQLISTRKSSSSRKLVLWAT